MTTYQIGTALYPITDPALGLGLFGFANPTQKTKGVETELYARAFAIAGPQSTQRIAIAVLDIQSCSQALKVEIVNRLQKIFGSQYTLENVLICGTHTHSAPDGFSHYHLYNLVGGGFDAHTFECYVSGAVKAIERAHQNMAPGKIYFAKGAIEDCGSQRSLEAYENNPAGEKAHYGRNTDNDMRLLKFVKADGTPIGLLNWYPLHPTDRGQTTRFVNGDNKGDAAFRCEKAMGTQYDAQETFIAAFANANCGDVSGNVDFGHPADGTRDIEHMEYHGRLLFNKAMELFNTATHELTGPINYRYTNLDMPAATGLPGAIGLSMLAGSTEDGDSITGLHEGIVEGDLDLGEAIIRIGTSILDDLLDLDSPDWDEIKPAHRQGHLPKPIVLVTGLAEPVPITPNIHPLQLFQLGDLAIAAIPAEITTMAGRRLRQTILDQLKQTNITDCAITAYANGYAQYITTREEYQKQHYEGASTLFGPGTLEAYQNAFQTLAQALNNNQPAPSGPPLDDLTPHLRRKRRITIRNTTNKTQRIDLFNQDDNLMLIPILPDGHVKLKKGQEIAWTLPASQDTVKARHKGNILPNIKPGDLILITPANTLTRTEYHPPHR